MLIARRSKGQRYASFLMVSYEDKTLEELDGGNWGEPNYNSHLVTNCHRLRRVPIKNFTVEDLRLMIGQGIGLRYLIPLALVRLEDDPFAEGDYYPGDLLKNVLEIARDFWERYPELGRKMKVIVERAKAQIDTRNKGEDIKGTLKEGLNASG
jgi:hypothetical protein